MTRLRFPVHRGCPGEDCPVCAARVEQVEYERAHPETDDWGADAAAADMVYGRTR
ncbi:MAG: hypothetical protein J2P43_01210 [Candidatus Dormibacteraeota bacterium]|nr:hypothetical protein [Candidatus Dormibacteraeota bacterium]